MSYHVKVDKCSTIFSCSLDDISGMPKGDLLSIFVLFMYSEYELKF
jgi:hypothetical protein